MARGWLLLGENKRPVKEHPDFNTLLHEKARRKERSEYDLKEWSGRERANVEKKKMFLRVYNDQPYTSRDRVHKMESLGRLDDVSSVSVGSTVRRWLWAAPCSIVLIAGVEAVRRGQGIQNSNVESAPVQVVGS